jgi:CheY-like chemotaxis protein
MKDSPRLLQIFLVEDHPGTLMYLRMYLEQLGHSVKSATTLQTALSALPDTKCDLLLCDVTLPDGSGWELLPRLGSTCPAFAVAMSGFGMNADKSRSLAAGFRHHLVKPFHPAELDALLAEASQERFELRANA